MGTVIRKILWIAGACLSVLLVGVIFLIFDSGHPKDTMIQQALSPDGKLVAELHQVITPMHGGPDTLYVSMRPNSVTEGEHIYSQTYECDDFTQFRLTWLNPKELNVSYGTCNLGRLHYDNDNKVWNRVESWQDIKINYQDTKYVANP